jgi:hypothetical protein
MWEVNRLGQKQNGKEAEAWVEVLFIALRAHFEK